VVSASSFAASVEQVLLAACVFWLLTANRGFFGAALVGRALSDPQTWGFALAVGMLLVVAHFFLWRCLPTAGRSSRLLALLFVATALAAHFTQAYGVYLDPTMLRNVLRSDLAEARELFSGALLLQLLLYAGLAVDGPLADPDRAPSDAACNRGATGAATRRRHRGSCAAGGVQALLVADAPAQGSALPDHAGQLPVVAGQRGGDGRAWARQLPRRAIGLDAVHRVRAGRPAASRWSSCW
jgi:hypothetical protein